MKLIEFLSQDVKMGEICELTALISFVEFPKDKNGSEYCKITIMDKESTLSFNVFQYVEILKENIKPPMTSKVKGYKDSYLFNQKEYITIGNPSFRLYTEEMMAQENLKISDFQKNLRSIDMPVEVRRTEILNEIQKLKEPYCEILTDIMSMQAMNVWPHDGLTDILSSFVTAPAAKGNHGSFEGGLFAHTLNMVKLADQIFNIDSPMKMYELITPIEDIFTGIDIDKLKFKIFIHDIGKIQEYIYDSSKGKIEKFSDRSKNMEHADYTISILREIIRSVVSDMSAAETLTADCAKSLRSHHGPWSAAQPDCIEDWMVFMMDMIESKIVFEAQTVYQDKFI